MEGDGQQYMPPINIFADLRWGNRKPKNFVAQIESGAVAIRFFSAATVAFVEVHAHQVGTVGWPLASAKDRAKPT
jgi:hypothetical protein